MILWNDHVTPEQQKWRNREEHNISAILIGFALCAVSGVIVGALMMWLWISL